MRPLSSGKRCHVGQKRLPPLSDRLRRSKWRESVLQVSNATKSTDHIPPYPDCRPSRRYSAMAASREQSLPFVSLPLGRVYPWITLTDSLHLPRHTDPTRAHLSSLITMDQLLEIWQERGHPKPGSDQKNALVFAHWSTDSMRSTEQHPARAEYPATFAGLSVVQEFPSQSPARFYEEIQLILLRE